MEADLYRKPRGGPYVVYARGAGPSLPGRTVAPVTAATNRVEHASSVTYVVKRLTELGRLEVSYEHEGAPPRTHWTILVERPLGEKLTHRIDKRTQKPVITCGCCMPSKGGGETKVEFDIASDSFTEVVKTMLAADETATIEALSEVLEGRDITIKADGDIVISRSKSGQPAAAPPAKPAPSAPAKPILAFARQG
jgi:hypothetical protein